MARRNRSGGALGVMRALNLLAFLPLASKAPLYGRLLLALIADSRVPPARKALLAVAAAYVVSPFDVVPERIPFLGAIDDVAVVVLAVDAFLEGMPEGLVREKLDELGIDEQELEADLERVRRTVPGPLRRVVARIPDAIDGIATFASERGLDRRLRQLMTEGRNA
jgi:uncharacterized membrane protein YkvA (DUF1232 family)